MQVRHFDGKTWTLTLSDVYTLKQWLANRMWHETEDRNRKHSSHVEHSCARNENNITYFLKTITTDTVTFFYLFIFHSWWGTTVMLSVISVKHIFNWLSNKFERTKKLKFGCHFLSTCIRWCRHWTKRQCSRNVNAFVTLHYVCYVNYSRCDQNIRFVDNG